MPDSAPLATPFTRLFGVRHPVVSAPMGRAAPPELVAAVTNAGGLGGLGLTWDSPQRITELVTETRQLTNDGPFLTNFVLEWDQHERLDAALSAGARIVSFFWGDPAPYIDRAKAAGALVIHGVGTPEEARRAVVTLTTERVARHFARELDLAIFEPPVPMRSFAIDYLASAARATDPAS